MNLLIVYPFFWGVGGCWDVLVRTGLISDPSMANYTLRGIVLFILMAATLAFVYVKMRKAKMTGTALSGMIPVKAGG